MNDDAFTEPPTRDALLKVRVTASAATQFKALCTEAGVSTSVAMREALRDWSIKTRRTQPAKKEKP